MSSSLRDELNAVSLCLSLSASLSESLCLSASAALSSQVYRLPVSSSYVKLEASAFGALLLLGNTSLLGFESAHRVRVEIPARALPRWC